MLTFDPAETSGGVSAIKTISAPLPRGSFCPTGGLTRKIQILPVLTQCHLRWRQLGRTFKPVVQADDWDAIKAHAGAARQLWV